MFYIKVAPTGLFLDLEASAYITTETQLRSNPDRGWRLEAYVNVANTSEDGQTPQEDPTFNLWNNLAKEQYREFSPQLTQVYFYLTGYKQTEILPEYAFDRMQAVFDRAKELGIKLVVRFAYQSDMYSGAGDAEDSIMLAHMKQLKPLLEKNADLIYSIEAGFLGVWGEWHSYDRSGIQHDEKALLEGIIDMVPDGIYLQVRYPYILHCIDEASPSYSRIGEIGIHNDSFFGYKYNPSAYPMIPVPDGTVLPEEVTEEDISFYKYNWDKAMEMSLCAPMGGELFWGFETDESQYTDAYDALIQYSLFRQSIFSLYHGYKEDIGNEDGSGVYSMLDWGNTVLSPQWLDENNIPYDPLYFTDGNGEATERNVLEFITDHLGYRLKLIDADISGEFSAGGETDIWLRLKNYGFSAAYNMISGFAVLDEADNVVSSVEAGKPAEWHSRDPENKDSGEPLTHSISGKLPLPAEPGKYKLVFYLKNSAGTGARLTNGLEYIDGGYTVIYNFEIPETDFGGIKDILVFDSGKDMYGEKAVNIIGDSISQGLNAGNLYDHSWASLFKERLGNYIGGCNMGYVSFNDSGSEYREIHTVKPVTDGWVKHFGWEAGGTPGNFNYTSFSSDEEILRISLNRSENGKNRGINGFYIYYTKAPDYGSFSVLVNGETTAVINCAAQQRNETARSGYICIPEQCGDDITVEIVKTASDVTNVIMINGIAYAADPDAVTVNNYSLSGMRLVEYTDALLAELAKANIVIFTLGTNDAGTGADIELFRHKLTVLTEACRKNGSVLIVGDVIWPRGGDEYWATAYKNALKSASARAGGYYIDFTHLVTEGFLSDICHPTAYGHSLIASYLCEKMGI